MDISKRAAKAMRAKITIEYDLPWPEGLTQEELRERKRKLG
jgi:hypothetical protein